MNAAHDYESATRMLRAPLPAYVSYVQRAHMKVGPVVKDDESTLVVRTSDGKIVRGKASVVQIQNGKNFSGDVVTHSPFDPTCYEPVSAKRETYDGRPAEAIALRGTCKSEKSDPDFSTLYVDPKTAQPLGVMGDSTDENVASRLEEQFTSVAGHVVPAAFDVTVKGSGWMSWLDVVTAIQYTNFQMLSHLP